jgi:drug/metabolite transporter (DMT)-like permease
MQFTTHIGDEAIYLVLAIIASGLLALGVLVLKGRAHALPVAEGRAIAHAVGKWISDPIWLSGLGLQTAGYALYVIAQAVIPVAIVSVMMQGGIGLFVLLAVLILGESARPAEWAGIAGTILGMVLMALSLSAGAAQSPTATPAMLLLSILLIAVGLAPYAVNHLHQNGIAAALFSGVMFGLASLYTKAMTDYYLLNATPSVALRILANPYVYATILTNIAGLIALQNSFAAMRGIIAVPLSTALSNIIPIAGATVVFGERLPANQSAAAMRLAAFALTIVGSALLTNPVDEPGQPEMLRARTTNNQLRTPAPESAGE